MARLGELIFDQLFVLMLHDALLHFELRTVGRHLGPKIAPLTHVKTELKQINPRPIRGSSESNKMLHLRRAKQIAHALTQLLAPFLWFHKYSSAPLGTQANHS